MKRRNFIRAAVGVATQVAVAPACLLAAPHEMADCADDWKYYEAFRDHCIRICKGGYEIKWCRLSPIRDGRRFVEVFHTQGVITFWMDWRY